MSDGQGLPVAHGIENRGFVIVVSACRAIYRYRRSSISLKESKELSDIESMESDTQHVKEETTSPRKWPWILLGTLTVIVAAWFVNISGTADARVRSCGDSPGC